MLLPHIYQNVIFVVQGSSRTKTKNINTSLNIYIIGSPNQQFQPEVYFQ